MFANLRERLKGWKTVLWNAFLGFAPVILVGLDKIQAIDLTQYMTWYMAIVPFFQFPWQKQDCLTLRPGKLPRGQLQKNAPATVCT